MDLLAQDLLPLRSSPLLGRRAVLRLATSAIIHQTASVRVRTRTRPRSGWLAFVLFGPRATGLVNGLQVRPGMMLVAGPNTEAGFVVNPGWESLTVLVPADNARQHLTALHPGSELKWLSGVQVLRVDPVRTRRLFNLGKRMVDNASRTSLVSAELDLVEGLLLMMRPGNLLEPLNRDRTLQMHSRIVTIAEDHVLARAGERVHATDLCRVTGVSERTLEGAFKAVVGLSPMAYMTHLRLHRVRAALLSAEQGSTRVSTEAIRAGFSHFGDFSRNYRQCFGELPSATLRRNTQ